MKSPAPHGFVAGPPGLPRQSFILVRKSNGRNRQMILSGKQRRFLTISKYVHAVIQSNACQNTGRRYFSLQFIARLGCLYGHNSNSKEIGVLSFAYKSLTHWSRLVDRNHGLPCCKMEGHYIGIGRRSIGIRG